MDYFHCPPNPLQSDYPTPPTSSLLATTDPFIALIVLLFPECHLVGIIQYVDFLYWFLSLHNMHLGFLCVFHGLLAHFFLVLNNIPLCGCTTVYLSIYQLKNTLFASKFLAIIKLEII